MRALALVLLLACGSSEQPTSTSTPPPESTPQPVTTPTPEPDVCGPFVARARHVAAADPGCARDEECACRSGLLFEDCGGPASRDTAVRLSEILREASRDGCFPEGPRCAARECAVACVEGRCVER